MTLSEAASTGDRLVALRALRDRLASDIDVCDSKRDLAALSKQFTEVLNLIESSGGGEKLTSEDETFDELAKRRAARGADAPGGERPAR